MGQTRLKSSFIYLANAVNDLRANWAALAIVLAPLVLIAAVCVLPDALNLQHLLAVRFAPGLHHVSLLPAQDSAAPVVEVQPLFPHWALLLFHILLAILTVTVQLFVMCTIRRVQAGVQHPQMFTEAIAIYREAIQQVPAFLWIRLLQIAAIVIGCVLLIVPGLLILVWLYFAEFALVFDGHRSFAALLRSRNLLRKRFFRTAIRIVVFMAVWSGYNSWVAGTFFLASFLIGPLGSYTGSLWTSVLLLGTLATAVGFATTAFFVAAGARLYRDLVLMLEEDARAPASTSLPATEPLPAANS
ncbi:MAG: hypothetical protein ACLQBA_08700 [Candidatus Binataceae bacterium]